MKTRRQFLRIGSLALAALLWPAEWLWAGAKKLAFSLSKVEKLQKVNGWAVLQIKGRPVLFVRDAEDSIKAFNAECTHKKCTVEYDPESKNIKCPCHGSQFHLNGKVMKEPAKKPLTVYPATISDGKVIVTIEE